MERIVLVGRYPPPFGGNTVHIKRLAERLSADGYAVLVADLYGNGETAPDAEERFAVLRRRPGLAAAVAFISRLRRMAGGAIVHVHLSAGRQFYRFAPVLLWATGNARRRVVTIHSGSWAHDLARMHGWYRRWAVGLLGRFDAAICVNQEQGDLLRRDLRHPVSVIPAFLASRDDAATELPDPIRAVADHVETLVITSGSGTPLYDYDTVITAVEEAQARTHRRFGLAIATYSTWNKDYWPHIEARSAHSSIPMALSKNLTPDQFRSLLAAAGIYIRASQTDGDSVAIREAAAAGARVFASTAVPRPAGTALFAAGSTGQLTDLLVASLSDPTIGSIPRQAIRDTYQDVLSVYGLR